MQSPEQPSSEGRPAQTKRLSFLPSSSAQPPPAVQPGSAEMEQQGNGDLALPSQAASKTTTASTSPPAARAPKLLRCAVGQGGPSRCRSMTERTDQYGDPRCDKHGIFSVTGEWIGVCRGNWDRKPNSNRMQGYTRCQVAPLRGRPLCQHHSDLEAKRQRLKKERRREKRACFKVAVRHQLPGETLPALQPVRSQPTTAQHVLLYQTAPHAAAAQLALAASPQAPTQQTAPQAQFPQYQQYAASVTLSPSPQSPSERSERSSFDDMEDEHKSDVSRDGRGSHSHAGYKVRYHYYPPTQLTQATAVLRHELPLQPQARHLRHRRQQPPTTAQVVATTSSPSPSRHAAFMQQQADDDEDEEEEEEEQVADDQYEEEWQKRQAAQGAVKVVAAVQRRSGEEPEQASQPLQQRSSAHSRTLLDPADASQLRQQQPTQPTQQTQPTQTQQQHQPTTQQQQAQEQSPQQQSAMDTEQQQQQQQQQEQEQQAQQQEEQQQQQVVQQQQPTQQQQGEQKQLQPVRHGTSYSDLDESSDGDLEDSHTASSGRTKRRYSQLDVDLDETEGVDILTDHNTRRAHFWPSAYLRPTAVYLGQVGQDERYHALCTLGENPSPVDIFPSIQRRVSSRDARPLVLPKQQKTAPPLAASSSSSSVSSSLLSSQTGLTAPAATSNLPARPFATAQYVSASATSSDGMLDGSSDRSPYYPATSTSTTTALRTLQVVRVSQPVSSAYSSFSPSPLSSTSSSSSAPSSSSSSSQPSSSSSPPPTSSSSSSWQYTRASTLPGANINPQLAHLANPTHLSMRHRLPARPTSLATRSKQGIPNNGVCYEYSYGHGVDVPSLEQPVATMTARSVASIGNSIALDRAWEEDLASMSAAVDSLSDTQLIYESDVQLQQKLLARVSQYNAIAKAFQSLVSEGSPLARTPPAGQDAPGTKPATDWEGDTKELSRSLEESLKGTEELMKEWQEKEKADARVLKVLEDAAAHQSRLLAALQRVARQQKILTEARQELKAMEFSLPDSAAEVRAQISEVDKQDRGKKPKLSSSR